MSIVTNSLTLFVTEENTVKISLTCHFNPEGLLNGLTEIVNDIYDVRYKIMFTPH